MSRMIPTFGFLPQNSEDPKPSVTLVKFARMLQVMWQTFAIIFNGNIGFGDGSNSDNINGVWSSVADTGTADTDFTVTHNLGRIPVGYLLMDSSKATSIYTGSVTFTTTQMTLKSSAANAAIVLFVI